MRAERVALVLLAAGRSERFGDADKLAADLSGTPLGMHAARTLAEFAFLTCTVVVSDTALDFDGFDIVRNERPELGMGRSLALGVAKARATKPDAILVALADMPHISAAHVVRILETAEDINAIVASSAGDAPMPPALFGSARFDTLQTERGDSGARALLGAAKIVVAPAHELVDIDTPDDLIRLKGA